MEQLLPGPRLRPKQVTLEGVEKRQHTFQQPSLDSLAGRCPGRRRGNLRDGGWRNRRAGEQHVEWEVADRVGRSRAEQMRDIATDVPLAVTGNGPDEPNPVLQALDRRRQPLGRLIGLAQAIPPATARTLTTRCAVAAASPTRPGSSRRVRQPGFPRTSSCSGAAAARGLLRALAKAKGRATQKGGNATPSPSRHHSVGCPATRARCGHSGRPQRWDHGQGHEHRVGDKVARARRRRTCSAVDPGLRRRRSERPSAKNRSRRAPSGSGILAR